MKLPDITWDDVIVTGDEAKRSVSEPNFHIAKTENEKRLVFGWALVSADSAGNQIIDSQGDIVDQDELETGAYEYVLNFRDAGEEHIGSLRKKARMVESVVFTDEKLQAMGIPAGTVPCGWWIGFYVDDDATWERIKNGTYKMFSIEGRAIREPITKEDSDLAKSGSEVAKTFSELMKFNPYHDARGRFTTAGGAASMTLRTRSALWQGAADKAIQRAKERNSTNKLATPIQFTQGTQRVRITELTDDAGEKSCKAQSRNVGQDWKDITDSKRLKGLRNTVDSMKEYEHKSTEELQDEYKRLKAISNDNYQQFTRAAASRSGSMVTQMADADTKMKNIKAVLDNRRANGTNSGNTASGGTKAIEIESQDGKKLSYRVMSSGVITDLQATGPKNTNGMTIEQLAERAKKLGWKVTTYDDKQLEDYDAKRAKDREETNRFLNHQDAKDRSSTYRAPRKGWKGH